MINLQLGKISYNIKAVIKNTVEISTVLFYFRKIK